MSRRILPLLLSLIALLLLLIGQQLRPAAASDTNQFATALLPGISLGDNQTYTIEMENTGTAQVNAIISLIDNDGTNQNTLVEALAPMSSSVLTITDLIVPAGFFGYASISADGPLTTTGTLNTANGQTFPVVALEDGYSQSFLAPFEKGPAKLTTAIIHNHGAEATNVTIKYEGQLCDQLVFLEPGQAHLMVSSTNSCLPLHYSGNVELLSQNGVARAGEVIGALFRYDPTDMHKLLDYRVSSAERVPLAISLQAQPNVEAQLDPLIETMLVTVFVLVVATSLLWRTGTSDKHPL